jgi:hypothetical protein
MTKIELPVAYSTLTPTARRAVREKYIRVQNGDCLHCGNALSGPASNVIMNMYINRRLFPDTFFKFPVHLHHDHNTDMTLGAVHCHCNAVLWQYHGE